MKPMILILAAAFVAAPLVNAANEKTDATARAEIVFVAPETFTDARDSYTGSDAGRDYILSRLKDHMMTQANLYLPQGYRLFMSVTDVDLAGDYEPWRGFRWDDVRIVKDIYPPRIDFSFRVTDASGRVVKEGKRQLRDMAFLMNLSMKFNEDQLRHEKAMLEDWFRSEFREFKKG